MNKKLKNFVILLISLILSAFLSYITTTLLSVFSENFAEFISSGPSGLYSPITFFILLVIWCVIIFKSLKKSFWIFVTPILLIIFAYYFLAKPFKVLGNDVGPYRNRERVLAIAKFIVPFRPVVVGDVVVFKTSGTSFPTFDSIAYVVGVPGDDASDNAYYLSNEKLNGTVPVGFYLMRFGESEYLRAIPESQITYIVWYPFK